MKRFIGMLSLAAMLIVGCKWAPTANDREAVLPGRHLSEGQVVEIACKQLPPDVHLQCAYRDGIWDISKVQTGVWGVASRTTNADGKVFITSTNALQLVLRIRDADGAVEPVSQP